MNRTIVVIRLVTWLSVVGALGVTFWIGHALQLAPLHMFLGGLLVLSLWALALLSFRQGARRGLGAFAVVWGFIVPWLGMTQVQILPGEHHWVVRVAHLLVGVVALALAERLAKDMRAVDGTMPARSGRVDRSGVPTSA
ncbi:MAG: hypothetical protein AB1451_12950 [Nitrospirota bacterium]